MDEIFNLKCFYWNVHGISAKDIGMKNENEQFREIISRFDIVCLSELHTHSTISIPGFTLKKQKIRKKTHRGPKISGGIAVFIKHNIANNFILLPNTNIDSIWLKTKSKNPAHLGFYYSSPDRKNSESDFFETINKELENLTLKSNTYIFGDFNARTKTLTENIIADKFDVEFGLQCEMLSLPNPRNSEDIKMNKRGKEFLDLCQLHNLCIANGRTLGDIFGKFTCHQKKGSSVVDYLITSHSSLKNVESFSIGTYVPTLSDHCPIYTSIHLETPLHEQSVVEPILHNLPNKFIWNAENRDTFEKQISSDSFKFQVEELMNMQESPDLLDKIERLLIDTATTSKVKKTSNGIKRNPEWFDAKCKDLKRQILINGKTLKCNPMNHTIREKIYVQKKQLRNLVRKNKYLYQKSIVDKMCSELSKGKQKAYWKLLKKTR